MTASDDAIDQPGGSTGEETSPARPIRVANVADAEVIAQLLHDFNIEFDTPSPGPEVLASRLRRLLAGAETIAVLTGEPPIALALMTMRPSVWYDGLVATLDELYVAPPIRDRGIGSAVMNHLFALTESLGVDIIEINVDEPDVDAQRFYVRHGFSSTEPDTGQRALYLFRELAAD